jgi:hypothetical protein
MSRYRIVTLVDISRTQARRADENSKMYAQQCNFNTLIQAIGLRANPDWSSDPRMYDGSLPSPLQGKARYWKWEFDVEREDLFVENDNPVALLERDLNGVPIIVGLDETADVDPPIFSTIGKNINTYVEII